MGKSVMLKILGAAVLAVPFLAACTTAPVYQPRGPRDTVGYRDLQITPNRYRVSFSGNSSTQRDEVEIYLLRRSAEITLGAGYTHFAFEGRETEPQTYYRSTVVGPTVFGPYGYYSPFYFSGWGWGGYPGGYASQSVVPVTRYTAYAEITLLNEGDAQKNPNAIPARDLLARLGSITPPPG